MASAPELLPWDDLQYFLELARRQTLAKAARRLGVSHTTVLRRVAALEKRLDRKLFDRSHAGFSLTATGHELLLRAEEMEALADDIFTPVAERGRAAGTVRLAVVEGLASKVLAPLLTTFQRSYPDIRLEVITVMQLANLSRREADISVSLARPHGSRLQAQMLATCGVHLYAARRYLEAAGTPRTLADLDGHVFVDYVDDMVEIQALRWLSDITQPNAVVFRSTSPLVQLSAVRSGLGIGMFPRYLVRDEKDLVCLLSDEFYAHREFWVAIHQEFLRIPRMQAVYQFVRDFLAEQLTDPS
ncbi:LysR family transcriptional regulator [Sphaerimonospora mesophila]|uniref:LysR family transcriptional regulator n=1 Tax=Sphaerimonospora mesophila TaxID=37483 RepID=UPI0006E21201